MISIDEQFVEAAAPNAEAAKNGRGLVMKNKFASLHRSTDETLLFGYCQGSGKSPYLCSADFAMPDNVVYRCSCPSRQFPCKHSLGLLFAYVQGKPFTAADVPLEISGKRERAAARSEKKTENSQKPRTVNKSALAKKLKAQLTGIDFLQKLTWDLVRLGIGNTNAKTAREIEEQAKQLGNAYLPGAQSALHQYTQLFYTHGGRERTAKERDSIYSEAVDQLGRLHSLVKQGRAYLTKRLENPDLAPEIETGIAAWLGHAWQLRELKESGLVQYDVELAQLAFNSHDDVARKEFVDTGVWMNLADGVIQLTKTFRPYKAARHIKNEDSFFRIAQIPELCIYPGEVNRRVRWEAMRARPIDSSDLVKVRSHGRPDFAAVIKEVKSHLKSPLADKHPIYALRFCKLGQVGDRFVIEDTDGERLVMTDVGLPEEPSSCHLLSLLPCEAHRDQTMLVRFRHDLDSRQLRVKPLSLITADSLIRLTL